MWLRHAIVAVAAAAACCFLDFRFLLFCFTRTQYSMNEMMIKGFMHLIHTHTLTPAYTHK